MSLIKLMTHIKLQSLIDQKIVARWPNKYLYSNYRKNVFESRKKDVNYQLYKKIFFGRNPYHRIISAYLDKYISASSVTPKDNPMCRNFQQFLEVLLSTGLSRENMKGIVDYDHFCQVTDDVGWDFYEDLGKPDFDYVSILPETGLPESSLTHHCKSIMNVYKILGIEDEYASVRNHYENHRYFYDTWMNDEEKISIYVDGIHLYSPAQPRKFQIPQMSRSIQYSNFYTDEICNIFGKLYSKELDFYEKLRLKFSP